MMQTTDNAANFVHETVDKVTHAANQAAEAVGEKSEQLVNAEQRMMKNCRGYVRDNPVMSLGIAVVAGFLLSRVLSGR